MAADFKLYQGFRDTDQPSATVYLYGQRGGALLFPLDLSFDLGVPNAGSTHVGKDVGIGLSIVGKVERYSFPPAGLVDPVTAVTPADPLPVDSVLKLPPLSASRFPNNTAVYVSRLSGNITGKILNLNKTARYIDGTHWVEAYIVQFEHAMSVNDHGAPVFTQSGDSLVGMVTATKRWNDEPNTLVCPV